MIKISACYFPGKGEIELTWENEDTGKYASLVTKVDEKTGAAIADVMHACIYYDAEIKNHATD